MIKKSKLVMVDVSATILHHGHIRLLKKASKLGRVVVALTSDEEVKRNKGYMPELNYSQRKEILNSLIYVHKVVKSKWLITNDFVSKNKIDILIRGSDYKNQKIFKKTIIFPRTKGISSSLIRNKIFNRLNKFR